MTTIRRIKGEPGTPYEVLFVDQQGHLIVGLTEWYHVRTQQGPASTRDTYLACLLPFFVFLSETGCAWNAAPEQLRLVLIDFYRKRLGCLIRPDQRREHVEVIPTRDTPLQESTLQVLRSALRDFYLVMRDERLYAFSNPLTSETLMHLKHLHEQAVANVGAPDHAGIRGESHERTRRLPTAFLRYPKAGEWKPDLRKELADVRTGIHQVLDAMLACREISCREKVVLELLRNTGARLHEIVLLTAGGYRNEGIAGQAQVVSKGSLGREIKTIYFTHNPRVMQLLTRYLEHVRPQWDRKRRTRWASVGNPEPVFLTQRGTPYSVKCFYSHWYTHYPRFRTLCPVVFSPHDIRHLFITEFLIMLRQECGAGTNHFDVERYQREREAFGSTIMGWRSAHTIDIYDHSRDGEQTLHVLGLMQQRLAKWRYLPEPETLAATPSLAPTDVPPAEEVHPLPEAAHETIWLHDEETLAWIKRMQQQEQ
jgi:site-specific recombinase XerD